LHFKHDEDCVEEDIAETTGVLTERAVVVVCFYCVVARWYILYFFSSILVVVVFAFIFFSLAFGFLADLVLCLCLVVGIVGCNIFVECSICGVLIFGREALMAKPDSSK